eukprot:10357618-Karenia_brevis.AAC.1
MLMETELPNLPDVDAARRREQGECACPLCWQKVHYSLDKVGDDAGSIYERKGSGKRTFLD